MKPWHAALTFALVAIGTGVLVAHEAVPGATAGHWLADPVDAAKKAGATAKELEAYGVGFWVAAATIALTVLGLAKRYAPVISRLVPVWGPMIEMVANGLWAVASTAQQKQADRAAALTHRAIAPILLAVRDLPPGTLPDHVQQMMHTPIVRAAIDLLVSESQGAKPVTTPPIPHA